MPTATLISVDEYLSTSYRPDCDYVDGEVQERNLGEWPHSNTQMYLGAYLFARRAEWGIRVVPEQRVQVSATRFRIPDLCVILASDPVELIIRQPPLLCIEILSREDTVARLNERMLDYFRMGVRFVWVIDPWTRRAFCYTPGEMHEALDGILRTSNPDISVPLAEIFESEA